MPRVPPSSAQGRFKASSLPLTSLERLAADDVWLETIDTFATRHPRRRRRLAAYEEFVDRGDHRRMAAGVLEERHRPAPPIEGWVNKIDGRKKRVFSYPAGDELLFRTVNRLVQPAATA